jgi:hypothetical protein
MSKYGITINGKEFQVTGRNIVIRNGSVMVDGTTITSGLSGEVHVKFEGALASLQSDGSVTCGNVHGDVSSGGSVECGDVGRGVNAGGSVRAKKVSGSMSAGGSIKVSS